MNDGREYATRMLRQMEEQLELMRIDAEFQKSGRGYAGAIVIRFHDDPLSATRYEITEYDKASGKMTYRKADGSLDWILNDGGWVIIGYSKEQT